MVTIIKKLATELAQCDYNELYELLETMSFVDAYNKLGGFNLQMDKCTNNNELLNIEVRFDYNFKHINGTIFQTKNYVCPNSYCIANCVALAHLQKNYDKLLIDNSRLKQENLSYKYNI